MAVVLVGLRLWQKMWHRRQAAKLANPAHPSS
jgi:hypothetical protein